MVVLGDFNLHHPLWNSRSRLTQHIYSDLLIDITDEFDLRLLTPQGLETWSAQGTSSIIDLAFTTSFLSEATIRCGVVHKLDHHSDHLPVQTELQLQVSHNEPVPKRAWERLNEELLLQSLRASQAFSATAELRTKEQIDRRVTQIHAAFTEAINHAVPWGKPCRYSQEFWTPQCTAATLQTRQLRRQALGSNEYKEAVRIKKNTI